MTLEEIEKEIKDAVDNLDPGIKMGRGMYGVYFNEHMKWTVSGDTCTVCPIGAFLLHKQPTPGGRDIVKLISDIFGVSEEVVIEFVDNFDGFGLDNTTPVAHLVFGIKEYIASRRSPNEALLCL